MFYLFKTIHLKPVFLHLRAFIGYIYILLSYLRLFHNVDFIHTDFFRTNKIDISESTLNIPTNYEPSYTFF